MDETVCKGLVFLGTALFASGLTASACAGDLDKKVRSFLESRKGQWKDFNVPWSELKTTIETSSRAGLSISYKRKQ